MALSESSPDTATPRGTATAGSDADGTVVWLRGEHDISTVAELSDTMSRAIARDHADLVVDLSEVEFMSAATVGAIVRSRNFLRLRSRSIIVRAPSRSARLILDICGLGGLGGLVDAAPIRTAPIAGSAPRPRRASVSTTARLIHAVRRVCSVRSRLVVRERGGTPASRRGS